MDTSCVDHESNEQAVFFNDVTDEALEAAASTVAQPAFTVAMCTGQAECPF